MSSAGGRRHGRRDNGLHAAEYAVAGDVDPRVGEHLLDVLGLAGIAAYLQPTADLHPVTRTTTLPSRPIDRLYVDRDHLDEAREFLDKLGPSAAPSAAMDPAAGATPAGAGDPTRPGTGADPTAPEPPRPSPGERNPGELSDDDVRDAWAAIVAEFDAPSAAPVPPWPVSEDVSDPPAGDDAEPADEPTDRPAGKPASGLRPATSWRSDAQRPDLLDELDAEEDEGYEPPPPPPLPRPSLYTAIAVLGIAGGLVLCIRPELLSGVGIDDRTGMALGFCVLLAGFVTLVVRLRSGDDEDEDDDDGAVV
ncbi:hypothetical protein Athai_41590 [Actinocatenispora thailandica]|uniref:DUF308 domain-containing protein n=1 Tax=Actinocatenispora thailandica TaxID=227318 RepID=A0A7R7DRZ8_9ACTN|nr:DUF308 domain-containing protein [Actinocatenispora thailandica]BCJ36656.1 hypothetical protein Athai_41590 [Actinocatenispora thailandica]